MMSKAPDKTRAIVLQSIRYGDSSLIVKMLTEKYGIQSYMVKSVFGNKSKMKPAFFQNMTLVDIIVSQGKTNIGFIKEISLSHYYKNIHNDIKKTSIILFISELLYKSITEAETDVALFDFIFDSMIWLDEAESGYANFPIVFALKISRFLGFYPNIESYQDGYCFDMLNGNFSKEQNDIYTLDKELSTYLYNMCLNDDDIICRNINNKTRRKLLESVVSYFKLHIDNLKEIRSYDILHSIMN